MTGLPEIRTVAYWIFGILLAGGVLVITQNIKELIKQAGGTTLLVRIVDTIVPERLRARLSWKYLHAAWWLWIIFGLSGGVALGFWLNQPMSEIRMGPRTAIGIGLELSEYAFEKSKHPGQQFAFAVIITAPPENAVFATFINELFTIPQLAQRVRILPSPGENDVSPLKQLKAQESAGIIIHGDNEPFVSGIAVTLGKCFIVSTDNTLPPELEQFYK